MKRIFAILFSILIAMELTLIFITIFVEFEKENAPIETYFLDVEDPKIDSLVNKMSLDEKIGQLFILELNEAQSDKKEIVDSINQKYKLGGFKFKNTEVLNQLILTNYLRAKSNHPLFVGSEGSIINRENIRFPIGPIINSIKDSTFAGHYLALFSNILKHEGVNIEFSNSINVLDSVNTRDGFADIESRVIEQTTTFRKNLHKQKIISCVNHRDSLFFCKDSLALDSLSKQKAKFKINDFFALKLNPTVVKKIAQKKAPYSISEFNKKYYGFKGLILSQLEDTLTIEEFKNLFESGTDAFILKSDLEKNINTFKYLVENNMITEQEINKRIKRLILAKKWAGADKLGFKSAEISLSKIITEPNIHLSWKLYKSSFSLVKNRNNILPFESLLNNKTHLLIIGKNKLSSLQEYLNYYMDFSTSQYKKGKLSTYPFNYKTNLIVAINDQDTSYFADSTLIRTFQRLDRTKNLIVINFGNPSIVKKLEFADVILQTYDQHPFAQANIAQSIAGALQPKGKFIPSALVAEFKKPHFKRINRLKYTIPEAAGFNSYKLKAIDSLINQAIYLGATPGGQVLAVKDGKVFLYKSYGYHTYAKRQKVKNLDIYDLASISKVAATTLVAMKLFEVDSIDLEDSIKYYIDDTINCTIKNHQLTDFFIHKTGMPADMPILQYISYRDSVTERYDKYYSEKQDSVHTIKVADNYFLREDYLDSVVASLYQLEIDTTKPYLYSDINFNIIYDILLRKLPESYKKFVYSKFYQPLQLRTTCYLPLEKFSKYRIAPTQNDKYWRKQVLRGTPHDESAALYGGISGNAGLFSDANDLAILFQMLINGGTYAGQKIFEKTTVEKFTLPQKNSRRGLGFNRKKGGLFGHSGFTGCVVWANPQNRFIYIFLSNSIHPRATNKRLRRMKIRSKVYNLIWNAYQPRSMKLNFTSLD